MLDLAKVAVTGGISCGKSSVCRAFKELGAFTVSADEIVHQLLLPETDIGQKVIALIGDDIVVDHKIDRSVIAKKVFQQSELLQKLENLLHPAVWQTIEKEYDVVRKSGSVPLFVAEVPLLFETGGEKYFDASICVRANEEICKARFIKKTGLSVEEYERRAASQFTVAEKANRSTYIIDNNEDFETTKKQVEEMFTHLTNRPSE